MSEESVLQRWKYGKEKFEKLMNEENERKEEEN